jgi:hypothetical protein
MKLDVGLLIRLRESLSGQLDGVPKPLIFVMKAPVINGKAVHAFSSPSIMNSRFLGPLPANPRTCGRALDCVVL